MYIVLLSFFIFQILLFALVAVAIAAPGYYYSPLAYHYPSAPAVVVPSAYSVYSSHVVHSVEPVEQHGYKIAY